MQSYPSLCCLISCIGAQVVGVCRDSKVREHPAFEVCTPRVRVATSCESNHRLIISNNGSGLRLWLFCQNMACVCFRLVLPRWWRQRQHASQKPLRHQAKHADPSQDNPKDPAQDPAWLDRCNRELLESVNGSGECFLISTKLSNRVVLRFVLNITVAPGCCVSYTEMAI